MRMKDPRVPQHHWQDKAPSMAHILTAPRVCASRTHSKAARSRWTSEVGRIQGQGPSRTAHQSRALRCPSTRLPAAGHPPRARRIYRPASSHSTIHPSINSSMQTPMRKSTRMRVQAPIHPRDSWKNPATRKGPTTRRACCRGSWGTAHCRWKDRRTTWFRNFIHFRERRVTQTLKVTIIERQQRKHTGEEEAEGTVNAAKLNFPKIWKTLKTFAGTFEEQYVKLLPWKCNSFGQWETILCALKPGPLN